MELKRPYYNSKNNTYLWNGHIYSKTYRSTNRNEKKKAKKFIRQVKLYSRCIVCGESRPWVLQFHHTDKKEKFLGVPEMANKGFPIPVIKEELRKCDCLCANDHLEKHFRGSWLNNF